ncbi:MAG: flagellar basal body rod protein FlgC [Aurantimonas coralicida]|jgi:flagellar basal-body rod protein FlgC|uniref:Flagellar basal-body rod protein FlgC n=1 Tax=Aurantimonas manganoxydans (strain ATCC BAA-1229 / DSM 21871 / SI85-9A1) TaxID=287752 RepID=Q1YLL5_AURMS|nr:MULTISPECIES: flagellar basal body rod protein FlgC [Aurantimonas]MAP18027.1 flagellar basal body rod protein FlgC [Aurantimonas sp.]MCW7542442.1 flagellar basal body rod protein FlgC [Aurantimonas litoralis]EAS51716.1 flagellar basal-body rod protein flgC [Aurantimonas manganoxydans SI85-9A1]MBC6716462.1 flagellar basal body rod protein FlgC [Aurantimonas sp. DM33-3]MCC4297468.1 flagellar basal body rod protein FlgC [Aurantimonas coralicida]
MADPLLSSLKIAASGLQAQSTRMRIVSENIANAQTTGTTPGSDPYQRKMVSFQSELDRVSGAQMVSVDKVGRDDTPFILESDPGNPAANADGYVKMPNVRMLVEMADMREANRSYEANIQVVKQAREIINMTIDLLRS